MHTDPYHTQNTHKLCTLHTSRRLWRHCDGIPLSHLSVQGIVGVMYGLWGPHLFWIVRPSVLQSGIKGGCFIWHFLKLHFTYIKLDFEFVSRGRCSIVFSTNNFRDYSSEGERWPSIALKVAINGSSVMAGRKTKLDLSPKTIAPFIQRSCYIDIKKTDRQTSRYMPTVDIQAFCNQRCYVSHNSISGSCFVIPALPNAQKQFQPSDYLHCWHKGKTLKCSRYLLYGTARCHRSASLEQTEKERQLFMLILLMPKYELAISPSPDSPGSCMMPLHPFTSAVSGEDLWMAMPWIYTWDLTIIHPCSFHIGGLLKVNCTG